jgi:opacity protein-like surface antigen
VWAFGIALLLALAGGPLVAGAVDADQEFAKGTVIVGLQGTGGVQFNLQHEHHTSGIDFVGLQPRVSYLPFAPIGGDWLKLAIEPGAEGWFHYYLDPQRAAAGGLKAALRLNGVGLGRLVPYIEGLAGAGGTGLDLPESRSTFTFILEAGAGASLFVAPAVAVNLGYRLQHLSNGNLFSPNRGYNAHTGVAGVSLFFR